MLRLKTKTFGRKLFFYEELEGSSMDLAKELVERGEGEGTVVITETEKARGRMGRKWYCPKGSGILLSSILKPGLKPHQLLPIPLMAGVAAVKAIRGVAGLEVGLKWVNDIILEGKKAGGILVEIAPGEHVILGMGINVNRPPGYIFPEGLEERACFLSDYGGSISRLGLLCSLLGELEEVYQLFLSSGFKPVKEEWKRFSLTLGRMVRVVGAEEVVGWAEDIDDDGALILRLEDGRQKRLISEEISIRTPEGKYI